MIIVITTQEFNKLTAQNFAGRLAQANLASKNDIAALVKKTDFDHKLKNLNKNIISNKKQNMYLLKMNLKKYRHLAHVFLLVKTTFLTTEHSFTLYLIFQTLYYTFL